VLGLATKVFIRKQRLERRPRMVQKLNARYKA
jgi:hypothetical protein